MDVPTLRLVFKTELWHFIGPRSFSTSLLGHFQNIFYASLLGLFWRTDRWRPDKTSMGSFSIRQNKTLLNLFFFFFCKPITSSKKHSNLNLSSCFRQTTFHCTTLNPKLVPGWESNDKWRHSIHFRGGGESILGIICVKSLSRYTACSVSVLKCIKYRFFVTFWKIIHVTPLPFSQYSPSSLQ